MNNYRPPYNPTDKIGKEWQLRALTLERALEQRDATIEQLQAYVAKLERIRDAAQAFHDAFWNPWRSGQTKAIFADAVAERYGALRSSLHYGKHVTALPDGADDLGLDREARWQPDGADLVTPERLRELALIAHDGPLREGLDEAAAALTAAQEERATDGKEVVRRLATQNKMLAERVAALEEALRTICDIGETRDVRVAEAALSPQPAEKLREEPPR